MKIFYLKISLIPLLVITMLTYYQRGYETNYTAISSNSSSIDTKSNNINEIVNDMKECGEAKPHGAPKSSYWAQCPEVNAGNNPDYKKLMLPWGQVYETEEGNKAANSRVQIRNLFAYYLSKKDNKWHKWTGSKNVSGYAYVENFAGDVHKPADLRTESDSTISVKAGNGYNFHFWSTKGRAAIEDKNDIAGVFITCEAKLIVDNPQLPDDRDMASYILSVGGDYWVDRNAKWEPTWHNNGPIACGRFKYVKKYWRSFNLHTMSEDAIRKNPPPMNMNQ